LETIDLSVYSTLPLEETSPNLIVAFGTQATAAVIKDTSNIPVLSAFIPRISFNAITANLHEKNANGIFRRQGITAIYLDQPIERRLNLIRLLLPKAHTIGSVLGPETASYKDEIKAAAKRLRFSLTTEVVHSESALLPALNKVLSASDVLLAVVDPLVFNRGTAQSVLLTSYRYRVPLIGISPSYTRAGALAAVYSSPKQVAEDVGGTVLQFFGKIPGSLPPPMYPLDFSVSINKSVARSLGVRPYSEAELVKMLKDVQQ
jgi:ABC-type uncharacterized transport system substrate-binding protein